LNGGEEAVEGEGNVFELLDPKTGITYNVTITPKEGEGQEF
jgi:hypothetical protein